MNFWLHFGGHIFGDNNSKCMDYTHFFNIILIPVITNSLFYPPPTAALFHRLAPQIHPAVSRNSMLRLSANSLPCSVLT